VNSDIIILQNLKGQSKSPAIRAEIIGIGFSGSLRPQLLQHPLNPQAEIPNSLIAHEKIFDASI
jgi:hypothetical protein